MKLPISIISVGIGLGYADTPTHYANEDYACIRSILGNSIYTLPIILRQTNSSRFT